MSKVVFALNNQPIEVDVMEGETLLYTLRERLGIKSVKEGCGIGECGACTVLVNDLAVYSCIFLTQNVHGKNVTTVEGLGRKGRLHPLQSSFIKHGAVQCGFCTPGMLLSAYAFLKRETQPSLPKIRRAISGNLCRCTGYVPIITAIMDVAKIPLEFEPWELQMEEPTLRKDDILASLREKPEILLVAGGTDLMLKLRKQDVRKPVLSLSLCADLKGILLENNTVRIRAATTHRELYEDNIIRSLAKSIADAAYEIGSVQIQNVGTVGGNIVNASPAADLLPPLLVHDARVMIESLDSSRYLKLEEFLKGPYSVNLERGEIVSEIHIVPLQGYREGFVKVGRRKALAIARLSIAYAIRQTGEYFEDVRIAIGSCTPKPIRLQRTETFLTGKRMDKAVLHQAAEIAVEEVRGHAPARASHRYKLPVLKDLLSIILAGGCECL